jgi:hypothetical protein
MSFLFALAYGLIMKPTVTTVSTGHIWVDEDGTEQVYYTYEKEKKNRSTVRTGHAWVDEDGIEQVYYTYKEQEKNANVD